MASAIFAMSILIVLVPLSLGCALSGVILTARRQAMLPDALSHATFPGVIVAAFLRGNAGVDPISVVIGALFASAATIGLIQILERYLDASRPQALAVIYPSMLSLGLVLMVVTGLDQTGFDAHTVLFGSLDFLFWPEALGLLSLNTQAWMDALTTAPLGFHFSVLAVFWLALGLPLFRRQLQQQFFDETHFQSQGARGARFLEFFVLTAATLAALAAFFIVGAIMAVVLFAAPVLVGRAGAQSLISWLVKSALVALGFVLLTVLLMVLIPEVFLPALGLPAWHGLRSISLTGAYAVLASTIALATLKRASPA